MTPKNEQPELDLGMTWKHLPERCATDHEDELGRLKRLLKRFPDLLGKALEIINEALARGAKRIRTDWIVAELGMFHSFDVGNENREALARLVLNARPELQKVIHLRKSNRADFIKKGGAK